MANDVAQKGLADLVFGSNSAQSLAGGAVTVTHSERGGHEGFDAIIKSIGTALGAGKPQFNLYSISSELGKGVAHTNQVEDGAPLVVDKEPMVPPVMQAPEGTVSSELAPIQKQTKDFLSDFFTQHPTPLNPERGAHSDVIAPPAPEPVDEVLEDDNGNLFQVKDGKLSPYTPSQESIDTNGIYDYTPKDTEGELPMNVDSLLSFIGSKEAPAGYNQVFGERGRPRNNLGAMTIDEVQQFQADVKAKGGRSTAVGRYQFMANTLGELKKKLGLSGKEMFTPQLQDKLARALLARRGLAKYEAGEITKQQFANNLAQEWASLPVVDGPKAGKSHYDGDGLNKALVSVQDLLDVLE